MSDTEAFDTMLDDKARAAHAAGPVGYDEEGVRQAVRLFLRSIGEDPDREGRSTPPIASAVHAGNCSPVWGTVPKRY